MDGVSFISIGVLTAGAVMAFRSRASFTHALLYLIPMLLAVALLFAVSGREPLIGYAAAILLGAVPILAGLILGVLGSIGPVRRDQHPVWTEVAGWRGPTLLSMLLLVETARVIETQQTSAAAWMLFLLAAEAAIPLFAASLVAARPSAVGGRT